jgi:hypothetical protein
VVGRPVAAQESTPATGVDVVSLIGKVRHGAKIVLSDDTPEDDTLRLQVLELCDEAERMIERIKLVDAPFLVHPTNTGT